MNEVGLSASALTWRRDPTRDFQPNACCKLRRAGGSRPIVVLLLGVRAGSRSNFGPAGARIYSSFDVEQERFCRKVTIPAPALVQLYQIHQTTVCEQTPFL